MRVAEIKNRRNGMDLLKRLCREEYGQGLVEYTLVVVLVALVFWMGVRDVQVGDKMAQAWARVLNCVTSPFSCSA
jgi:Flp pilus assembly pilin Flp